MPLQEYCTLRRLGGYKPLFFNSKTEAFKWLVDFLLEHKAEEALAWAQEATGNTGASALLEAIELDDEYNAASEYIWLEEGEEIPAGTIFPDVSTYCDW